MRMQNRFSKYDLYSISPNNFCIPPSVENMPTERYLKLQVCFHVLRALIVMLQFQINRSQLLASYMMYAFWRPPLSHVSHPRLSTLSCPC